MNDTTPDSYLGVSLGSRAVGFAVIAGGALIDYRVVNLRSYPGVTLKEEAFLSALERLMQTYRPRNLAFCYKPAGGPMHPLVAIEWHALEDLARTRKLPRQIYRAEDVRKRLLPETPHPTNRDLVLALVGQFGLEDERIEEALGNNDRRVPSDRERYWTRTFLALGAAELLRRVDIDIREREPN